MKSVIINSSELGTNCWSALRLVKQCFKCRYYDRCKYPERVVNKCYDRLRVKLVEMEEKLREMLNS